MFGLKIVAFLELSQLILERRYFGITDADLVGLSPSMRTSPICAHINTVSAHCCAIQIQSGILQIGIMENTLLSLICIHIKKRYKKNNLKKIND